MRKRALYRLRALRRAGGPSRAIEAGAWLLQSLTRAPDTQPCHRGGCCHHCLIADRAWGAAGGCMQRPSTRRRRQRSPRPRSWRCKSPSSSSRAPVAAVPSGAPGMRTAVPRQTVCASMTGVFPIVFGVVSYRIRILMYLDVSCVFRADYMYPTCILMYLKCILNAPFYMYSKSSFCMYFDMYPKGVP